MSDDEAPPTNRVHGEHVEDGVGDRIYAAIREKGLSQAEAARRSGIAKDALGRYVSGKTAVPLDKLIAIARGLEVKASDLDPTKAFLDPAIKADLVDDHAPPIRIDVTPECRPGEAVFMMRAKVSVGMAARLLVLVARELQDE